MSANEYYNSHPPQYPPTSYQPPPPPGPQYAPQQWQPVSHPLPKHLHLDNTQQRDPYMRRRRPHDSRGVLPGS
ncbi:hypothetical protein K440DRAFT_619503 [Wilcoxina mikolae CBS 423.85]|nr:hypothetical protein K440DRAFT_619503 [Wilcoxina mikolae CBS 423.85]